MILKKQTKLRPTIEEIKAGPEQQAFRALYKVLEFGLTAKDATASTIKDCLSALA